MNIITLNIKVTTSKAQDSYGCNRVTLTDTRNGKKYATVGYGYDMRGTVFGDWLTDYYQQKLRENRNKVTALYGASSQGESVYLDGGCGFECMVRIAACIGVDIERVYTRNRLTAILAIEGAQK